MPHFSFSSIINAAADFVLSICDSFFCIFKSQNAKEQEVCVLFWHRGNVREVGNENNAVCGRLHLIRYGCAIPPSPQGEAPPKAVMRCSRRSGVTPPLVFPQKNGGNFRQHITKRQSVQHSRPGLRSKLKRGLEDDRESAHRSDSKPFFNQTAAIFTAANQQPRPVFCFSFDAKEKRPPLIT